MYGNRGGWRGPPPRGPWGEAPPRGPWGDGPPPRFPARGGYGGGGGFPNRGRGGFQGGFPERPAGGNFARGGRQPWPRNNFTPMNPQPGPSSAPPFQQPPVLEVKKEEPVTDDIKQSFDIKEEVQRNASQFVPKSEPVEPPKPSIPLQIEFKDGEPVLVDDTLIVLDWCKFHKYARKKNILKKCTLYKISTFFSPS